jgi:SAM-dependent methyltransferase
MLSVANSTAVKEGLPVEYGYASACDLPFKSESFDAVLCLQGLQYFPSPSKALHEIRRVLRSNALFVSVTWSEIQNCKGYWAMVSALERRQIEASAARKPFALADGIELKLLATQAGFKDVSLRTEQRLGRFRSTSVFLDAMLQAAPSSRLALEKVPAQDWSNFQAEVEDMLRPWRTGAGIEFPMACNVLVAQC